jgi:hypothetical protein
MERIARWKSI